jgi:two-component system response regulator AtoC
MAESPRKRVLIVDDEPGVCESLKMTLKDTYDPVVVSGGEQALEFLDKDRADIVLLDVVMPGMDGMQALERIKGRHSGMPVVMLTATKTIKTAVEAMRLGAFYYVTKPFDVDELRVILGKATETGALVEEVGRLRTEVGQRYNLDNIVGRSPQMQDVFKTVLTVAPLKTTVLITGESGTGKELIAKAIHYHSPRAEKTLVTLNCAAIPTALLESELFGHEKGSFTDAHVRKLGQFELADQGTIFLDEIGEMNPQTQAKLLRVLEQNEFLHVGGTQPTHVDVRIIAATNRNLTQALKDGSFRPDLYYRLNVVSLHLPPLRERREDLALLIRHFTQQKSKDMRMSEKQFHPEAVELMLRYPWPGNVRELENVIERVLVLSDSNPIPPEELPEHIRRGETDTGTLREQVLSGRKSIGDAVDEFEREVILEALNRVDFNQTRAADLLGTTRRILKYRMDKLGIQQEAEQLT